MRIRRFTAPRDARTTTQPMRPTLVAASPRVGAPRRPHCSSVDAVSGQQKPRRKNPCHLDVAVSGVAEFGSSLRPMGWQGGGEGGWRRKRACVPSLPTRRCAARSADDATCVTREAGLQSIHVRQRGAQNFHLHRRALAAEARPRRLGGRMFHQVWSGRGCPGNARNGAPTRRRRAPGSPSHRSATSPLGRSARQR